MTAGQLESMLAVQRREGRPLSKQLVEAGFLTEERLVQVLGEQLGVETVDLVDVWVHERVRDMVLASVARRLRVLPLARRRVGAHDALLLAMVDPLDDEAVAVVGRRLPDDMRVVRLLAGEEDLLRAVDQVYGPDSDRNVRPAVENSQPSVEPEATLEDAMPVNEGGETAPLARPAQTPSNPVDDPATVLTGASHGRVVADPTFGHRDRQTTEAAVPIARSATAQAGEPATQPVAPGPAKPPQLPSRLPLAPTGGEDPYAAMEPPLEPRTTIGPPPGEPPPYSRGPKSGGGHPSLSRAPATEVIRTRGGNREAPELGPERKRRTMRDVTRRLAPPGSGGEGTVPLVTGGPTSGAVDLSSIEPSGDPEILVKAVVPRVPPALLVMAVVSLLIIIAVGVWATSTPPTVRANLPTGRLIPPIDEDGSEIPLEPPDPPIAPLRRAPAVEIAPGVVDGPPPAGHSFVLVDGLELRAHGRRRR